MVERAAINEFGDVCGESDRRPFVKYDGAAMEALPVPKDTQYGWAALTTSATSSGNWTFTGRPVGSTARSTTAPLWRNGTTVDLNTQIRHTAGWGRLWNAWTINNAGIIGGCRVYDVITAGFC
jgi:hypothetical protein